MKRARFGISCVTVALLSLVATPSSHAGLDEQSADYTLHYYSDVDGFRVFTHYGGTGLKLENSFALDIQWAHDVVVFPAIEAAPGTQEAVDAITTASRPITGTANAFQDFVKKRNEFQGTGTFRNASATYYVSTESDYFAQMFAANYNRGFLGDNLNLSGGASYSWDHIEPLADDDTQGIPDFRRTFHWNVVATQVLTRTTVVRVGAEFNTVRGLQHDPYRNVYVAGTNVPEKHPNDRYRQDAFIRVSQYIKNKSSIKLDYRYYTDDWGLDSHTIGGKVTQYLSDDVVMRYRYRYYTQLPTYFYRDEYEVAGGVDGFQTNDFRLGDYGAHLFGGQFVIAPGALGKLSFLDRLQLVIGYERYFNSNNFSANIYETGLQITF